MSGHSKFANIKHKKEKNDAKKGKVFTVIGREIVMAVKAGGADPNNNSKLRDVIAKAKANNMPNDTIERGIKKAAGADSADSYERATYEGYGPNGVAIIVETLTDNKNRTAPDDFSAVREALEKAGIPMVEAQVAMVPQTYVDLTDEKDVKNLQRTLDLLDEDDDVTDVWTNWNE